MVTVHTEVHEEEFKRLEEALARAGTELEQRRVQTWKEGVWDYMVEGRGKYVAGLATP